MILLNLCGGERPDIHLLDVVKRLHWGRGGGAAVGGKVCSEDHRVQLTISQRHLYYQVQDNSHLHPR